MSIIAEYIWIDNFNSLRSKARTVQRNDQDGVVDYTLSKWNFDGSSTGQAVGSDSEIILEPIASYKGGDNILVLCECFDKEGTPVRTNHSKRAKELFDKVKDKKPWFGLEQEYVLYDLKTNRPLGWGVEGFPEKQGKYYCGVGAGKVFGRHIVDEHYDMCLKAGLTISGVNAEVFPGQWEFQVGPCEGLNSGKQMWMARYLLERVCEKYDVYVSLDPKPIEGDWNGSGCHMNFSDVDMRSANGIDHIYNAINKLESKHIEHIECYGDNNKRLSGTHETSPIDKFSFGIGNREASIRIPTDVGKSKCGYFEDRRPASDCDPYIITSKMCETIYEL
jgi:glutamine synthetase